MHKSINEIILTLTQSLKDLYIEYGLNDKAIDLDTTSDLDLSSEEPSKKPISDALNLIETFIQSLPQTFQQNIAKAKHSYKEPGIAAMLPRTFSTVNQLEILLKSVPDKDQKKADRIMEAMITLCIETVILYAEDLHTQLIVSELPAPSAPPARQDKVLKHWKMRYAMLSSYSAYLPVYIDGALLKKNQEDNILIAFQDDLHAVKQTLPASAGLSDPLLVTYKNHVEAAEELYEYLLKTELKIAQDYTNEDLHGKLSAFRDHLRAAKTLSEQLSLPKKAPPPHIVTEQEWQTRHVQLLEYQAQLAIIARNHATNEEQRIDREVLITRLQIRIATAKKNTDELIHLLKKREQQLKYQDKGRIFAILYGMGQGGYCAGFMMALIGLEYFLFNALMSFGWPSLLIIFALTPLILSSISNYWVMRKDLGVMSMKLYEKRHAGSKKNTKTAEQGFKKYDNYVLAIVSAFFGGVLISTLTAFGVYQFFPHIATIALAAVFFTITAVPEVILNVNHNVKFWTSPFMHFKKAYSDFTSKKGNHYFARLMGWFTASLVGMAFTALALTSLGDMVGIPFYISFPMLAVITFLNISFYFNRAYDHVSRQRNVEEGLVEPHAYRDQLTPRFSVIRFCNAVSNGIVAVIGFLATAYSAGWITLHGTADLALSNMGTLLNFSSSAVILCLLGACVVGYLAAASSYTANAGGEQQGYEAPLREDIAYIRSSLVELTPQKNYSTMVAPIIKPTVTHWYRYQTDAQELKRFEKESYDLLKGVVARRAAP